MAEDTPTPEPTSGNPPADEPTTQDEKPTTAEKDPEAATPTEGKDAEAAPRKRKSFITRMKHAHMDASTPLQFIKSFFLILFHTSKSHHL